MLKKSTVYLIFAFFLIGCSVVPVKKNKVSRKEMLSNQILHQTSVQLKQEFELHPIGHGGRAMHEIEALFLSFFYYKPLDVERGRRLILNAAEFFINSVNQNEEARQYLSNYPFESKNIELTIFLYQSDGNKLPQGELSILSFHDGKIEYDTISPQTGRLVTFHKETIEEARKIVSLSTH